MTTDPDGRERASLAPGEAFAALGNETRMDILHTLSKADEPLPFSTLRDLVGMRDSGQFNYHLDKLKGHFVRDGDDGYTLMQAGHRVIEAVLSGAVTGGPHIDTTSVEAPCLYCGGGTELQYREERLLWRCRECPGSFGDRDATSAAFGVLPSGTIDLAYLPSAGIEGRTPKEMLEASDTWSAAERVAMANGVCPRCAGTVEDTMSVCADHDADSGVCEECHTRLGAHVTSRCTNCTHAKKGTIVLHLLADPTFRSVFDGRGVDVISTPLSDMSAFVVKDQRLLDTDPFRAELTYEIRGESVTLLVDRDLSVTEVAE